MYTLNLSDISFKIFIFVTFSLLFFLSSYILFDISDPYLTDKFYISWLASFKDLCLTNNVSTDSVIQVAMSTIKAPDPFANLVGLASSCINGSDEYAILYAYSVLIIFLLSLSVDLKKNNLGLQLLLLFSLCLFSFYWFVLFNITHRLKIAFFFLILSFYFSISRPKLSKYLFVASIFSHYTILIIYPLIYLVDPKYKRVPQFSVSELLKSIAFFILLIGLFVFQTIDLEADSVMIMLNSKFPFINGRYDILLLAFIAIVILSEKLELALYKYRNIFILIFYGIAFVYLGPSRLLQLVYLTAFVFVFFNPNHLRVYINGRVNYLVVCFYITAIYDFGKSISLYISILYP